MLTTEGTYPFHMGGVSTWAHILINGMPHIDFNIYSIMMNPFVTQKYDLPANVTRLIKVPLWGTEEPSEHLTDVPFSQIYLTKQKTTEDIIRQDFMPIFTNFIKGLLAEEFNPLEWGRDIFLLYQYFKNYDYLLSFKSETAWDEFRHQVMQKVEQRVFPQPSIFDMTQALGWLYRFMVILNTPIPRCDVVHSAAAAFCGIPGVLAKQAYRTPFLVTEHGVYLREQYLSTNRQQMSSFSKLFMMQLVNAIVQLNYAYADVVSPVCKYNTRWELRQGVAGSKIKVIYNGVDPKVFTTRKTVSQTPTVVTIARIDPLKDIETLIQTAAIVKKRMPDARFIVYGPPSSTEYYEKCLNLRDQLGLQDTVIFAGQTDDAPSAYHEGDVVLLTSISEAFPYTVIEAMMSGKAVVASDVGGTREALEGCGLLVPPREPQLTAQEIIRLFDQPQLRVEMENESRDRALTWFSINKAVSSYFETYEQMTRFTIISAARRLQMVNSKRGMALLNIGERDLAVYYLRQAVTDDPLSPAVPVILTYIASAYFMDGKFAEAHMEMKKADLIHELITQRTA